GQWTLEPGTRQGRRRIVLPEAIIDKKTVEAPKRCGAPCDRRWSKIGPIGAEPRQGIGVGDTKRSQAFGRTLEIVAVSGKRVGRGTGLGSHHVEEAVDGGAVVGCH